MSEITKEWLDDVYRRQPYTWDVPDTDLFLYQQKSGYYQGLTMICRHEPDGDETDLCYVADQEQLVRMLSLLRRVRLLAPIMWDAEQEGDSDG